MPIYKNKYMKSFDKVMELEKKEHFPSDIIEGWIEELELYIENGYCFPCPCVQNAIRPTNPQCFYYEDAKSYAHLSPRHYCYYYCERALLYNENIREIFEDFEEDQTVPWITRKRTTKYIIKQLKTLL